MLFLFFLPACIAAQAQITRIEPASPRWGQIITVTYDSSAESSSFKSDDQIYLYARAIYPDKVKSFSVKMTVDGSTFRYQFKVAENLSSISFHFLTLNGGWDEQAFISTLIYRSDGKPARGALMSKIGSGRYQEYFKQEIQLYPDNYTAWSRKWALDLAVEGDKVVKSINSEVWKLNGLKVDNPELLYALSFGHVILGREEQSRNLVRQLFDKFPESGFTAMALASHEAEIAARGEKVNPETDKIRMKFLEKFPESEYSRSAISTMSLDQRAPLSLIEEIAGKWISDEPENPLPYFNLAQAYRNQYQKYDLAVQMVEKSIRLLIEGRMRLYGDINGKQTREMLPVAYLISADIAFRRNKIELALPAIKAAQSIVPESDHASYLLEGRVLEISGNDMAAESAFIEAWRRGSQEAEENLKRRYQLRRGNLDGFDEYLLRSKTSKSSPSIIKRPSPNFRMTSLDGKIFDLAGLRGKIVVLNLWFISCGPCRREIPRLNEIVAEFKNSPVVFIAPSFDDAEALKTFLKTNRFEYNIVPDAEEFVVGKFNATLFPTHIIIDADGQIESVMIGAAPRRPEEVRRELLRLLDKR